MLQEQIDRNPETLTDIIELVCRDYTVPNEEQFLCYIVETKTKSFKEAFAEARKEYGADDAFLWRGEVYSTNYAEENKVVENVASSNGWVLNSNDLDDYCATNNRDECGICGGDGALLWYADRDGDGLGDAGTTFSSCEQPNETK